MKTIVVGTISFIGGVGWTLFGIFIVMTKSLSQSDQVVAIFALLASSISCVLYVVWTNFGKKTYSELEKIDYANQLLKKQIEQKELISKLEN